MLHPIDLALNMRMALEDAAFLRFVGTYDVADAAQHFRKMVFDTDQFIADNSSASRGRCSAIHAPAHSFRPRRKLTGTTRASIAARLAALFRSWQTDRFLRGAGRWTASQSTVRVANKATVGTTRFPAKGDSVTGE